MSDYISFYQDENEQLLIKETSPDIWTLITITDDNPEVEEFDIYDLMDRIEDEDYRLKNKDALVIQKIQEKLPCLTDNHNRGVEHLDIAPRVAALLAWGDEHLVETILSLYRWKNEGKIIEKLAPRKTGKLFTAVIDSEEKEFTHRPNSLLIVETATGRQTHFISPALCRKLDGMK